MSNFTYKEQVSEIIETLDLETETDKSILKSRFLGEVLNYEERRNHTKKYYNIFRFIVTTGSIILPAILSMGQMDPAKLPKNFDNMSYWASWTISLMVTGSNGFLQLFSLDKNYFEYALTTEQLKTEGWQFFQLSGKYEECESHKEAYKPFSKSIENIKRKQVEKEFPGKADVNKNKAGVKKEPKFNFQDELMKQLPDQYESQKKDIEKGSEKISEMTNLMDSKMNQLNSLVTMLESKNKNPETITNVKDIFKESIAEQVSETAKGVISDTIDKAITTKENQKDK